MYGWRSSQRYTRQDWPPIWSTGTVREPRIQASPSTWQVRRPQPLYPMEVPIDSSQVGFSGMILWWIRAMNEFEVSSTSSSSRYDRPPRSDLVRRTTGNSLERIQQYIDIEQEPKATESGVPPASWPTSGDLVVQGLSARYSEVCITLYTHA